jgi:hypothetical protein
MVSITVRAGTWAMVSLKFRVIVIVREFVSIRLKAMDTVRFRLLL